MQNGVDTVTTVFYYMQLQLLHPPAQRVPGQLQPVVPADYYKGTRS